MKHNNEQILQILKTLNPTEKIEINHLGRIQIVSRNENGKITKVFAGTIYDTVEEITPVKSISFVTIPTQARKSFSNFGKVTKKVSKDYNTDVLIGTFETLLEILPVKYGVISDQNRINYNTRTVGELTGYYNKDNKLRFVVKNGKRYYNTENPPSLNTVKYESIIP